MMVNYLKCIGMDCTVPGPHVNFSDAAQMTQEENDVLQGLYGFGIFQGKGSSVMDPAGSTSHAQRAALMHRLSVFASQRG